ncbi:MAG: DUF1724 domain-containing protein [Methanoregulaceae archaeon]|nr:DUF1724 domain-containing protein [Methanoregulaceae archaeon]
MIHSIFSSRLKIQILLSLLESEQSLSELRKVTGSVSQALIPKIRKLEDLTLVESSRGMYKLTPFGKVLASIIGQYINAMIGISRQGEFWTTHKIDALPLEFLDEIGDLLNSEVIFDTGADILHVYTHYLTILKEAGHIYGISSVMSPALAEGLAPRVLEGIPVEIVVSREVVEQLQAEPYAAQIRTLIGYGNFRIWVTEEALMVGLTVTDRELSLGLYKKDGKMYDSSTDLSSSDPAAVKWGEKLFGYYRKRSTRFSFHD